MSEKTAALDSRAQSLLLDAAEWRLLGLLFEYPAGGWRVRVAGLAGEVSDARLRADAEAAPREASEGMHHSIFGPGGPVPPREVSYLGGIQFGYLLSELSAYYQAFAYQPQIQEAEDHISVETGFVAYLRLKEAYALSSEDQEHAAITSEAARRFIEEHLAAMAEPIATALEAVAPPYLVLASRVLAERVGPPRPAPGAEHGEVLGDTEESDVSCGESPALISIDSPPKI